VRREAVGTGEESQVDAARRRPRGAGGDVASIDRLVTLPVGKERRQAMAHGQPLLAHRHAPDHGIIPSPIR
jgi:hypothetical protein